MTTGDVAGVIGDVLVFLALVAALVTAKFTRDALADSRRAGESLGATVGELKGIGSEISSLVALSQRLRAEEYLIRRLTLCQQVSAAVEAFVNAVMNNNNALMQQHYLALLAALAPFNDEELTNCRRLTLTWPVDPVDWPIPLSDAQTEIETMLAKTRRELNMLLGSVGGPV